LNNKSTTLKISILASLICLFFLNGEISAQKYYFYTNKPYGSESLFNPLSLLINGGFDITQLQSVSNRLKGQEYARMAHVVNKNLGDPFTSISHYGWSKFLRTEFLPISFTVQTMQWVPNYQQHLFGCGMLFTAMKEYYQIHGCPMPWLLSSVTLMSMHYLNEVMESGPNETWSVDEISDIYIFDLGGIVLFSFDNINEFFSKTLNLSDWSSQAAITFPNTRVNAGQYFAIKWKLPFSEDWSMFYRYGMGALYGLSKKVNPEDNISVGLGFKTKHLVDLSTVVRDRTIETGWYAGVFYDRNNSLLASLVMSGVKEQFCMADVYPGVLKIGDFSPGLWAVIGRNGNSVLGLTFRYFLGTGYEFTY
jgi:hypothetical protein